MKAHHEVVRFDRHDNPIFAPAMCNGWVGRALRLHNNHWDRIRDTEPVNIAGCVTRQAGPQEDFV